MALSDSEQAVPDLFGSNDTDVEDGKHEEEEEDEKYRSETGGASSHSQSANIDVEETSGIQFKGLKNQGATCYLNALLQSLYFTPELRAGIYKLTEQELGVDQIEEAEQLDKLIKANTYPLDDMDVVMLASLGYTNTRVASLRKCVAHDVCLCGDRRSARSSRRRTTRRRRRCCWRRSRCRP